MINPDDLEKPRVTRWQREKANRIERMNFIARAMYDGQGLDEIASNLNITRRRLDAIMQDSGLPNPAPGIDKLALVIPIQRSHRANLDKLAKQVGVSRATAASRVLASGLRDGCVPVVLVKVKKKKS